MPSEQLNALVRSLRFRLTAWNTAVVLLTVIVTLFGVHEGLRRTLVREIDQLLLEDAQEVGLTVEQYYPSMAEIIGEMNRKVQGHRDRKLFVQLIGSDRRIVWSSANAPTIPAVTTAQESLPRTIAGFRVVEYLSDGKRAPDLTVRVGSSLALVQEDVSKLTRLMTAAGVAILIVAPLGGYWLAGRATSPLGKLIATADRLRPDKLEERLPVRDTGDELDRLSLTINRFLDRIADYLDRNREFVANAAHELRSPLAAIQSSVEVALNSVRSAAEYEDLLCEIAEQCRQLSSLVNQLLELAEMDADRVQLRCRPVYLDQLVNKCLDMFAGAADERNVRLVADYAGSIVVEADEMRLRQVVNNLVDNSLKYTPSGGLVKVSLANTTPENAVQMTVADNGTGIAPDDLPHIFERFFCADKSRHRGQAVHGSGLGLSICQSIVAAHGGSITATSEPGRGTTIIVSLPAANVLATAACTPPAN